MDSHADTTAGGKHCRLIQETGSYVTVEPFTANLGSVERVPICTIAIAYDDPEDGSTYVLFFHQALYIKDMVTNLLSPFQMREFGVQVNDVPLQHLQYIDGILWHTAYLLMKPISL